MLEGASFVKGCEDILLVGYFKEKQHIASGIS